MRQLFSVFLLITFCYYAISSNNSNERKNITFEHGSACTLGVNESSDCCANENKTEDINCSHKKEGSTNPCEKPCCEDFCCCVKVLKTLNIATPTHIIPYKKIINSYVEITFFTFQQYLTDIFKPPKNIV